MTTFLIISPLWIFGAAIFGREYQMKIGGFLDHFFWLLLWPAVMAITELA